MSAPRYIPFRVLPWSQPNLARRSGAPGDVRYLRTMYREHLINVLVELERNCVRVVPELGPQIHRSRDKPWAGALRSMGDHSEILVEVKTHNEKASTAQDSVLAVGVKGTITRHNSGAVTRISGDPS